eukprot:10894698-Karenia_brevis.AAC.1
MENLHHLDYLDGQPSPSGLPGWTNVTAYITWMDDFCCLHYLDGEPSLPGSLGWTTFSCNDIIIK